MKKIAVLLSVAALAAGMTAPAAGDTATPAVGKMLYTADGKKLAPVYRLDPGGAPQIMLDGRLYTVPAATLTTVEDHLATSLTKKDLVTGH